VEYIETKRSILPSDVYVKNDAAVEAFPSPRSLDISASEKLFFSLLACLFMLAKSSYPNE
jgi:hypothetical protein